jgi:hypothetical protein
VCEVDEPQTQGESQRETHLASSKERTRAVATENVPRATVE